MDCAESKASSVVPAPEARTANFIALVIPALLAFANLEARAAVPPAYAQVRQILHMNKSATHEDWHAQENQVKSLKKIFMSSYDETARCQTLNALAPSDLMVFYDDLTVSTNPKIMNCATDLRDRLQHYLTAQSDFLQKNHLVISSNKLSRCSDRQSTTFGPAVDFIVDHRKGGVLFGENHPKCGVTFTFDDGPHATLTPELLKILEKEQLLVNFFVVGRRVAANPALLRAQRTAGHLIGNHSMNHLDMRKLSFNRAGDEIEQGFNHITQTLGEYLPFFRFPFGAFTKDLRAYLDHLSRVEFYWNIDTLDWKLKAPEQLFTYALEQIEKAQRGIILMHDIQPQTIVVLPYLLAALREAGYTPYLIRPTPTEIRQHVP